MNRKISLSACLVLMLLAAVFTYQIAVISTEARLSSGISGIKRNPSDNPKLSEAMYYVENYFVKDIDREYLDDATVLGYILGLQDKHSSYYTKEQFEEMTSSLQGSMTGIGIRVFTPIGVDTMTVFEVMKDSPAEKAGIQKGDVVYSINEKLYSDLKYEGAYEELLGNEGESVTIEVLRGEERVKFDIIRTKFEMQTVSYKLCDTDSSIGYVKIYSFDAATTEQFKSAVETLLESGAKSFIFDVRDNPGGTLDSISQILDYLLPEGPIIHLVGKNNQKERTITSDKTELSVPMVVLADSSSASAAELFTSALMDHNKATFIGVKTYGKGTVQTTFGLSDGSGIRISTQYYLPPYSPSFDGLGIEPDITVELSEESKKNFYMLGENEDEQLNAAINYLMQ